MVKTNKSAEFEKSKKHREAFKNNESFRRPIVEDVTLLDLSSNWKEVIAVSDQVFMVISERGCFAESDVLNECIANRCSYLSMGMDKEYKYFESKIIKSQPKKVVLGVLGATSDKEYLDQMDSAKKFILSITKPDAEKLSIQR